MPSLGIKPTSIALFPTAADRSTLIPNTHQQHYLSPPLTPFPHFSCYNDQLDPIKSPISIHQLVLPALREMLPHEKRQQTSPPEPERLVYSHSAMQHPSERGATEILENHSVSTYRGGQHMTDPARLLPIYAAQPHSTAPQPSAIVSPLLRRNKAHVASACVNCKKAHLACDGNIPSSLLRSSMDVSPHNPFTLILYL
jgi:hypothetical protein